MECTIDRAALHAALNVLVPVAERKTPQPILQHVLLRLDGRGGLTAVATDAITTIAIALECKTKSEGEVALPAKELGAMVASMPGETIKIALDGLSCTLTAGRSKLKLQAMAAKDFPKLPAEPKFLQSFDPVALAWLIGNGGYAANTDLTRTHIAGGYLTHDGSVGMMCSTDGHRGSLARYKSAGPEIKGLLLGIASMKHLVRLIDPKAPLTLGLAGDGRLLAVKTGSTTAWIVPVAAQFPPLEQVCRKTMDDCDSLAIVPRKALIDAVKRTALGNAATVNLTLKAPNVILEAEGDTTAGRDEIEVGFDGKPITVGMEPKYLVEALEHLDGDEIKISCHGELDPVQLSEADSNTAAAVIMPKRQGASS